MPDLTLLLDMPVEKGQARKHMQTADRIEREGMGFHRKVHDGYLTLAGEEPSRWLVVDASQTKDRISDIIWEKVKSLLDSRYSPQKR
jgi:dTMP kinase